MATPIDFNAIKKEELSKQTKAYTFKEIPRTELYNALQVLFSLDHLLIILGLKAYHPY